MGPMIEDGMKDGEDVIAKGPGYYFDWFNKWYNNTGYNTNSNFRKWVKEQENLKL